MIQTSFIDIPAKPAPRPRKTAAQRKAERERRFKAFCEKNGHVYEMLRDMALKLKAAGHEHWGMRNLYEKLRYDLAVQTTEAAPNLNDWYAPMFARLLMQREPELRGMFKLRGRD